MKPEFEYVYDVPMTAAERRALEDEGTHSKGKEKLVFSDLGVCTLFVKREVDDKILTPMKKLGTQILYDDDHQVQYPRTEEEVRQYIKNDIELSTLNEDIYDAEYCYDGYCDAYWGNNKNTFVSITINKVRIFEKGKLYTYVSGYVSEFMKEYEYPDVSDVSKNVPYFQIHDNGGRPFTVFNIEDRNLAVILKLPR